jgi:RNA polymerase sigma-70 factor (ECF subfamily)
LGFDAERGDLVQEAFAAALTSLHGLRDPASLEAWLSSVAANTARKALRERARGRWLRRFTDSAEEERYEPSVAGVDVEARRALSGVYAALAQLPSHERVVFARRFIDGMELAEVAAACQVSVSTIKRRLVRAERRFLANARNEPELVQWLSSRRARKSDRPGPYSGEGFSQGDREVCERAEAGPSPCEIRRSPRAAGTWLREPAR